MTTDSVRTGQSIAQQLAPMLRWAEAGCDDPVHFWAGLLSALAGSMVAAIGGEASRVIGEAVVNAANQVHEEKSHAPH